jgi:hypothetical protein
MDPNYLDPVPPPGSSATGSYQPYTQTQTSGGSGVVRNHQFQKLTHPAPPFLLRDTWEMLTHPDVPLMKLPTAGSGYGPRSLTPRGRAGAEDAAPAEDIPGIPQPGMGTEGGYGGYGAEYGGSGYGGSGYGSGEGTGTGVDPLVQPKYKLIRFTDMSVEAGRQYRYRLKVFLEDPNYPSTAVPAPPPSSLSNEVQDRVKKLTVADAKASADKTAAAKRTVTWKTFWRESDWSEPSEPVTLPPTEKFLALSADPPVTSPIMPNRPQVPNTQPSGKLLAVKWDPTRVADLAAKADVYRGSTLTFRAEEALAVHPVRLEMRSLPKVMFNTGAIVADIQGGDPIPQVKKSGDPLKAPAEILIFTADGQLSVEDGGTDIEEVRMHTVMEEKAAPDPYMSSSGSSEEGYEQMMNGPVRGGAGKGRTNRRVSP